MDKQMFKICDRLRVTKKNIVCEAKVQAIIEHAQRYGIQGSRLVLASDGSSIEEDEVLTYVSKELIMILEENDVWENEVSFSLPLLDSSISQNLLLYEPNTSTSCNTNSTQSVASTLSMSSGVLSSNDNSTIQAQSNELLKEFQIPWNKFPKHIIDKCDAGEKLGIYINTIVRIIVDELRTKSFYFPICTFRKIVGMLAAKYPDTFMEKDDSDQIISTNNSPLLAKLINHNNYLNRPPHRPTDLYPNISLNKRRKSKTFEQTCRNWQPRTHPTGETESSIKNKQSLLLQLSSKKTFSKEEWLTVKQYMSSTFAEQRLFLNKSEIPTALDIQKEWPFLLHKEFIMDHFIKLTEINIENYTDKYNEKRLKLLNYFLKKPSTSKENCNYEQDWCYISYITKYFKEKSESLLKFYEVGTLQQNIIPSVPSPWTAIVDTGQKFVLYTHADGILINSSCDNFKESLAQQFALYFILNVEYPRDISQTLEFIQRYFFNIYSDNSRGKKKNLNAMTKVMSLLNKIKEMK